MTTYIITDYLIHTKPPPLTITQTEILWKFFNVIISSLQNIENNSFATQVGAISIQSQGTMRKSAVQTFGNKLHFSSHVVTRISVISVPM